MSRTAIILTVVAVGVVGIIGYMVVKGKSGQDNPPISGQASGPAAGPAPNRTNNKVVNTVNDLLSFTRQGVDIYKSWDSSGSTKKAM